MISKLIRDWPIVDTEDLTLGPFYSDGMEIWPCTTEATDAAIEQVMGTYRLVSNVPELVGKSVTVTPRTVTEFIQTDWDRVMGDEPDEGFLLAYLSSQKAVGRLAEQLICAELFRLNFLPHDAVKTTVSIKKAIQQQILLPVNEGVRCDDLLVLDASGRKYITEVKASFVGRSYLRRCLPKAVTQLQKSIAINRDLHGFMLVLASIRQKTIALIYADGEGLRSKPLAHWVEMAKGLL